MHLRDERDVRRRGDRDGACVDDEPAAHARDERGERPDEADGGGQDGVDAVAEEYLCGWVLVFGRGERHGVHTWVRDAMSVPRMMRPPSAGCGMVSLGMPKSTMVVRYSSYTMTIVWPSSSDLRTACVRRKKRRDKAWTYQSTPTYAPNFQNSVSGGHI